MPLQSTHHTIGRTIRMMRKFKYLIFSFLVCIMLTSCEFIDKNMQTGTEAINEYLDNGDINIKFDTYSADDALEGREPATGGEYYDTKSGTYVSRSQYRANSFADAVKRVWPYVVTVFFLIGFLIRRLNHSSASLRRFALVLEVVIPILFSIFVYAVCYGADSSLPDFFNRWF